MKKSKRKTIKYLKSTDEIPEFKSEEEEAEFWDTHSAAKIVDQLEEVDLEIAEPLKKKIEEQRRKELISLRLYPEQIEKTKAIAIQKSIGHLTLMRNWIQEGIERELSKKEDIKRISDLEKQISLLNNLLISESELTEKLQRSFYFKSYYFQQLKSWREPLSMPEKLLPVTPSFQNPMMLIMTRRGKTKIGIPSMLRRS
ncbi:MAG TPA: CopG family antitoxin [Thermodesulfobacteriota bacterium]|nr:CopG family antitoxin [Thermodesulfobacteriota bacterium]